MSHQQAQIEALEHLVVALFKELRGKTDIRLSPVIDAARASILGSDGSGGPEQKSDAVNYLESLAFRLGNSPR